MRESFADITEARRDLGHEPRTTIQKGLPRFVNWFKAYHGPGVKVETA